MKEAGVPPLTSLTLGSCTRSERASAGPTCITTTLRRRKDAVERLATLLKSIVESYHQREGNTSMDDRSLIVLVAALLLFLAIGVFIVAYLFQPIPVH
jgi:hypothetical protein